MPKSRYPSIARIDNCSRQQDYSLIGERPFRTDPSANVVGQRELLVGNDSTVCARAQFHRILAKVDFYTLAAHHTFKPNSDVVARRFREDGWNVSFDTSQFR